LITMPPLPILVINSAPNPAGADNNWLPEPTNIVPCANMENELVALIFTPVPNVMASLEFRLIALVAAMFVAFENINGVPA
jgi:hypothetical protein